MASTYPLSNSIGQELSAPAQRTSVAPKSVTPAKRSVWRAVYDAMIHAQSRRAEREIARVLGNGRFTDSAERAAYRRYLDV